MLFEDKIPSSEKSFVSLSKNYTYLCFFFRSMKFKETFSSLIIHLALPGRNIDNTYHVVQILETQKGRGKSGVEGERGEREKGRECLLGQY